MNDAEISATEWEIESAEWRKNFKITAQRDWDNYRAIAEELGITPDTAMMLNQLSKMQALEALLSSIAHMLADYNKKDFPERWTPPETPPE